MNLLRNILAVSPAIVIGAVAAVLAVLVAFNLPLTDGQDKAIIALVGALIALGQGIVTHQQTVTPAAADAAVKAASTPQA